MPFQNTPLLDVKHSSIRPNQFSKHLCHSEVDFSNTSVRYASTAASEMESRSQRIHRNVHSYSR